MTRGRKPKPYYRKASKKWVCTIHGQRITLGDSKDEAEKKFHKLMANGVQAEELKTVRDACSMYETWLSSNRSASTYDTQMRRIHSFANFIPRSLRIFELKPIHVSQWVDAQEGWGPTTINDAMSYVQRVFNWAIEQGMLDRSPIPKLVKPRENRREDFYSEEQFKQILEKTDDNFGDFLRFLWSTGARPKESREISASHINDGVAIFKSVDSKGHEHQRLLVITDEVSSIISKRIKDNPTGPLFLNSRGVPWTKDAVVQRCVRISEKVGFRVIAYAHRHSYATNALINDVDSIDVAHLMGHRDTAMISKVYSHVEKNMDHLRKAARKARKGSGPKQRET